MLSNIWRLLSYSSLISFDQTKHTLISQPFLVWPCQPLYYISYSPLKHLNCLYILFKIVVPGTTCNIPSEVYLALSKVVLLCSWSCRPYPCQWNSKLYLLLLTHEEFVCVAPYILFCCLVPSSYNGKILLNFNPVPNVCVHLLHFVPSANFIRKLLIPI